jgi:hypothetical protein
MDKKTPSSKLSLNLQNLGLKKDKSSLQNSLKPQNSSDILAKKAKLVFNTLQKSSWYTGIAIKDHILKNLFQTTKAELISNQSNFQNQAIKAGRWSAYCHYSLLQSFNNLLIKHDIKAGKKVIINPILPETLVQAVLDTSAQTLPFDIDLNTLTFNPEKLLAYLESQKLEDSNKPIDLVVFYVFNGLYQQITQTVIELQKMGIASLVVVDNQNPNFEMLDLFEKLTLGSVIFNYGSSFWDDHLNQAIDQSNPQNLNSEVILPDKNWFVSWFIETRTRSVLEYSLSQSQSQYQQLLSTYLYLILEKKKKQSSLFNFVAQATPFALNEIYLDQKFKNPAQAVEKIKELYPKILDQPVPDLVFELQDQAPVNQYLYPTNKNLVHLSSQIQTTSKKILNYLKTQSPVAQNLISPTFYQNSTYFWVFVYLQKNFQQSEVDKVIQELENFGFNCQFGFSVHPLIQLNLDKLPKTQKIVNRILLVNLLYEDQFGVPIQKN